MSKYLPDDCSDTDLPDIDPTCPECGSELTVYSNDPICVDVQCSKCEYYILIENTPDDL